MYSVKITFKYHSQRSTNTQKRSQHNIKPMFAYNQEIKVKTVVNTFSTIFHKTRYFVML